MRNAPVARGVSSCLPALRSRETFRAGRQEPTYAWSGRSASPWVRRSRYLRRSALLARIDDEYQRLVRLDLVAGPARAVAQVGRNHEHPPAARLHALESLLPALDHRAL